MLRKIVELVVDLCNTVIRPRPFCYVAHLTLHSFLVSKTFAWVIPLECLPLRPARCAALSNILVIHILCTPYLCLALDLYPCHKPVYNGELHALLPPRRGQHAIYSFSRLHLPALERAA
jgi:hypothetical protein